MPIDARMVKWDEPASPPAIDARMVAWDQPDNSAQVAEIEKRRRDPGGMANFALGALKGASDIGATLLTPFDAAARAMGVSNSYIGRNDRRQVIDQQMEQVANPNSMAFGGGKLAAYVGGTAGAPGAMAKGLAMIPGAAAALPTLMPAIESGGMSLGAAGKSLPLIEQILARGAGGAIAGGVSSGMVNPADAKTGAMIGGVTPLAIQGTAAAGRGVGKGLGWLGTNTIGALTGTGSEAAKEAFRAGQSGSADFLDNVNGKVPMTDVVDNLKEGLQKMRIARSDAYKNGMAQISGDKTVLDMTPIQQALQNVVQTGSYKGQVLNKNAAGTVQEIADQVSQWSKLDPAQFHTPEGLDALKQSIGDIRDATQFGTPGRRAADAVYNAVKKEITQQAPTYAKVMGDYSEASTTLKELEKSLSAGEKSSADSAMRKLQSIMRNNVNTNYGNRLDMVRNLEQKGGVDLMPSLAGQAMNSWMPRGMTGQLEKVGLPALALGTSNPAALAAAPFMSPRLMGNALYGLGSLQRGASNALPKGVPMLSAPASQGALSTLTPTLLNDYLRYVNSP